MRKLSPFLTIYKFPITAISSITNRLTGIYIAGIFFVSSLINLNENIEQLLLSKYHNLNNINKKVLNIFILYPFGYHFMAGIRHLIWDNFPNLLTNNKVIKSSKLLFISSLIPTLFIEKKIDEKFINKKL